MIGRSVHPPRGKVRPAIVFLLFFLAAAGAFAQSRAAARAVEISLQGGQVKTVRIDLGSDPRQDLTFWARLEALPEGWPEDGLRIEVSEEIQPSPQGRSLIVRVTAEHCCRPGEYLASLALGTGRPGTGKTVTLPLKMRVERGPVCRAAVAGAGGFVLVMVLLWLYARGMYFNCSFLTPERVARHLVPQRWTAHSQTEGVPGRSEKVRELIEAQFNRVRRFKAWLLANPLVFGLPGKRYHETVALELGGREDTIRLDFMPYRDTFRHCQANLDEARGKLFASATPGGEEIVFGLPDKRGLIGGLRPDFTAETVIKVKGRSHLRAAPPEWLDDPTNLPAGWQIKG